MGRKKSNFTSIICFALLAIVFMASINSVLFRGIFISVSIGLAILFFIAIPAIRKEKKKRQQLKIEDFIANVIPHVLSKYDCLTEFDIGELEAALLRVSPFDEKRMLLYALRVSKCVPNIVKLETLASRYNTACYGAGGAGLLAGRGSVYYEDVCSFLGSLYLRRYAELSDECIIKKATATESKRKTKDAKIRVWSDALEKVKKSKAAFEHKLDGLEGVTDAIETKIESEIERLNSKQP